MDSVATVCARNPMNAAALGVGVVSPSTTAVLVALVAHAIVRVLFRLFSNLVSNFVATAPLDLVFALIKHVAVDLVGAVLQVITVASNTVSAVLVTKLKNKRNKQENK
jgi:uncharacterized membrane protein YqhA